MKKLLLFFAMILLSLTSFAAELNIYASRLISNEVDATTNEVEISYFLNAPATELECQIFNADKDLVTSIPITATSLLTKGTHTHTIDLSSVPNGTYTWAIKASASANSQVTLVNNTANTQYWLYSARGVAVNNYPETDNFGMIYVSNSTSGTPSKGTAQTKGIYIYDQSLMLQNTANTGIAASTWSTTASAASTNYEATPYRVFVGEDGILYISCTVASNEGVWMMNPQTNAFTQLTTKNVYGISVIGTGENRILYGVDDNLNVVKYPFGNTIPYTNAATTVYTKAAIGMTQKASSLAPDYRGGWWIGQYRYSDEAATAIITHMSATGDKDCTSAECSLGLSNVVRGVVGVNKDASLLASYTGGVVKVFSVSYTENNIPTIATAYSTGSVGNNIDGIAFDYADNMYVVSSSSERLHVYALPKADNSCVTPAASKYVLTVKNGSSAIDVTGISLNESEINLLVGRTATLTATVLPENATNKTVTWSVADGGESVVSVNNGIITALADGTAQVIATAGDFSASCNITVSALKQGAFLVGGANADFASLYDACKCLEYSVKNNKLTGNVDLLIATNLTETKNSGIINNTDYTITIRPDQDADRKISFTQAADNAGPSGAFIIGCDMGLTFTATPTKNVVIDGYAQGGTTRRLTIETSSSFGTNAGPIIIYGNVTNTIVKNCNIVNNTKNYGITLRTEKNSDNKPNGIIIENNDITTNTSSTGQCIYLNGSEATTPKNGGPTNCIIRNNILHAKSRGIFMNGVNGLLVEGNEFHMNGASGYLSTGIFGNTSTVTGNINIHNNRFVELVTANSISGDNGLTGILASGGGTWYIDNNYFGGFDATAKTGSTRLVGIRCGSTCVVRHNTFVMPKLTGTPATPLLDPNPIACLYLAANDMTVTNNIFVSYEDVAHNSLIRGDLNSSTHSGNIFYIATANEETTNAVIMDIATPVVTFDQMSDAIKAVNRYAEVEFETEYQFTESYIDNLNLAVTAIPEITTDIEGNARHTYAYSGCYEPSDIAASIDPSIKLMNEANTAEAGWVNFGSFVTAAEATTISNSRTYTLAYTDIDITSASAAIDMTNGGSYFIAELNEDNTQVTISYSGIPANLKAAYKGNLEISANDILGRKDIYTFPISLDVNEDGTPTNLDNINKGNEVQKIMRDGHVYIMRNGIMYTITGQIIK